MPAHRDPSVEELRRESERSRAALTNTVVELREKVSDTADELKTRLSPAHLKEEVKEYVRDGSDQFFKSIERKARENPLQAVAIGAGLAYPLWGILKTIPVPIMLIGAGYWLSRQKAGGGGNGFGQGLADKVSEQGAEGARRIADSVRGAKAAVAAGAETVTDKVSATAHDIRASVTEMGQAAMRTVRETAGTATDTVSAAAADFRNTAADFTSKATEFGKDSRTAFVDLVDRNPLLVAGVGLAIGAVIAASLPPSDAENRMFGEHSDDLKGKALEAASDGIQRAKDVATGVIGDVKAAAAREGIDAEGIGKTVHGVTEGVKSVVDRGLKTALGVEEKPPQSSQTTFQPNKS